MNADFLGLLDWKRRVFEMYANVRAAGGGLTAWEEWRRARDALFRTHDQSPVPADRRASFTGLPYYPHDPSARVLADVEPVEAERLDIATSGEEPYRFTRFARAVFDLGGAPLSLDLYWLEGYGGGLFVPFRDATSGTETYGAGRYLLDTVKGADLGTEGGRLVLDFNFAYNPSCAYDARWVCPLAPPANRLPVPARAGERFAATAPASPGR